MGMIILSKTNPQNVDISGTSLVFSLIFSKKLEFKTPPKYRAIIKAIRAPITQPVIESNAAGNQPKTEAANGIIIRVFKGAIMQEIIKSNT